MLLGTLLVNNNGLHATSTGLVIAKAFHIQKNVESLVRITDDDLRPLFGIRVISAVAIIFVHVGMLKHGMGVSNGVRLEKDLEDRWLISMCTLENVVDTFMFMSGLLLIKSLIANGMKPFNPVKVIVKRYFRLIGPVLLVLLIIFKILNVPRGPMKKEFYDTELEACNQNWWTIPLMIQNYVNKDNMCYAVLWSVACDFHLSILGTMGTWLFMRSRKSGLLVFLIAFIASITVPATGAILNPEVAFMQWDFRVFTKNCKYILENPFYTSTHYRASSYFVGMAVGYLIAMYNPAKYRNVISKKHSILSFGVLLAMFLGFFTLEYKIQTELILKNNVFMLALFVSLRRVVWAVLLAVLVILCEYGTLPLVPGFLGWSALAPICRLSYGIYLIHGAVLSYWTVTTRNNIEHHLYNSVLTVLGVALASCVASLLLWTLFEEPLRIIVSHILRDRNENAEQVKRK
ncbi:O-acyltransferase like protein-like [Epargyreus clarus]|uniref:O-acyltransferase like protein-like n=1 Tax=Epargyreus clarus TaxID=520877 RepID=UPI003C2FF4F1